MPDGVMNVLPDLRIRQSGNVDLAYLGKVNGPGTVYRKLGVEIDLTPNTNNQLIARSEYIVRSDIYLSERSEGRRNLAKEAVTVNRKKGAQRATDQQLEVCRGGGGPGGQKSGLLKGCQLGLPIAETTLVNNTLYPAVYS